MNLSQARVVDPVLTTHVRGWRSQERVGHYLFPAVETTVRAGKVLEFGKESFALYNARRAPGGDTKQIEFGYEGKPYALYQDSLDGKVPREFAEDAAKVPGVDLGIRATNIVMNSLTLALEYEQAQLAGDANNYPAGNKEILAGASQWDNAASTPVSAISQARNQIRTQCGVYPNVLVLGPKPYNALKNNNQVTARFKNIDIITPELLAKLLEVDYVVEGRAVYADDAGAFKDIWGNFATLAYAPPKPNGIEEPSFGYTYTLSGHPFVEEPAWNRGIKSWLYGVTYERAPVLTGVSAGYLFQSVTSG
ncbi:hypothetical protein ELI03_34655 [Rhizobium leguminosarum]|uniref:Capsid protein n=1 Tax=Rhizobium leguminosarum TaxID=384 RepID=A0A4Q8XNY9_RHILE|nr:major capsid protein [Rhizobium leguminosarum]TAX26338.1 hypothetical protein ELI06_24610 [Rhizobium leguminosarum]TAX64399.1 hypothetical protein ELI03_34655 [Rhizobium leguminosarum]